jgi:hypothetical protein
VAVTDDHAASELWNFKEEGKIFLAPADDGFAAHIIRFLVGILELYRGIILGDYLG